MLKIDTVLCPVDFTPVSEQVAQLAARTAHRFGARLVLEHNLEAGPPEYLTVSWMWSGEHRPELGEEETACAKLQHLMASLPEGVPREAKLSRGPVEEALLYLARALPADLLVMASHGASSPEHRSVTERILADAPCPVLTTTPDGNDRDLFAATAAPDHTVSVLLPFDFSPRAHSALAHAWLLADTLPLSLHLLYVIEGDKRLLPGTDDLAQEAQLALARLLAEVPADRAVFTTCHVAHGKPADEIQRVARELAADLILMGVREKGFLKRLATGATAFDVLHGKTCPVLFVPDAARRGAHAVRARRDEEWGVEKYRSQAC